MSFFAKTFKPGRPAGIAMVLDELLERLSERVDGVTDGLKPRGIDVGVAKEFSLEPFIGAKPRRHPATLKGIGDEAEEEKRAAEN